MASKDDFNKSGFRKGKGDQTSRIPGTQARDAINLGKTPVESSKTSSLKGKAPTPGLDLSTGKAPQLNLNNSQPGLVKEYGGGIDVKSYDGGPAVKQTESRKSISSPAQATTDKQQNLSERSNLQFDGAFKDAQETAAGGIAEVRLKSDEPQKRSKFLSTGNKEDKAPDTALNDDIAFSLQYRIPKKLASIAKNEPEKLKKLAKWFMKQIESHENDREEFMEDRLPKFRATVLDFISAGLKEVFEGQHNIHIPLAFSKCRAMHARIFQSVLGVDPIFSLKPRFAVTSHAKDAKEQLLNFIIKNYANYRCGIYEVIDKDIWNFVSDGTAVTRHWWKKDVRKYHDIELEINKDGEEEEVEVEKKEIIFDGPMLSTVPLEDFYMIGDTHDDADTLDVIAEWQRYTKSDLITYARQGFFMKDAVDYVIDRINPDTSDYKGGDQDTHQNVKEYITGMRQTLKESGIRAFNVFEGYIRYDIDDDGVDEELVVWIERNSRTVLRITYLERVGPGGKRPYVIKRFSPREGSPYGVGLGEMLFGLNNEVDYLHNLRLDSAIFRILPMFKYRKTGNLGKEQPKMRVGPGAMIGLEDVNDLEPLVVRGEVTLTNNEEQKIEQTANSISISELSMGQISGQGATRTATGTAALVSAADALLDISIKRYQQGFKRNLQILDKQVVDLLPRGTMIRMTGPDGAELMKFFDNRDALKFDVDFELEANSATSNKAIERELSSLIFQNSLNPILIQTGVVGPEQIKNAYVDFLKANDRKNYQRYIQGVQETLMPARTGKDELTMILMGVKPEVQLNDRHQEKLALFEEFEKSPEGFGILETDLQIQLYYETKQAHEQFVQALAAQANQVAQAGFIAPQQTAQIAAGAGNPSGQPAQQMSDLIGGQFDPAGGSV